MSNEQRTLNEMVKNHEKRVKEMEQVLIDYAMEHNLHLTLTDEETYTSRTLITKRVYDEYEGYATSSEEGEEYPPDIVLEWSGLSNNTGFFYDKNGNYLELTALNDSGKSFKKIADIIEANYKEL